MAKKGQAKRTALANAAAEQFWTRGYAATSIADIAEAAAIPVGNVYYYYKTKADLALAVADSFVVETQAMIDEVSAAHRQPRERMVALVARLSRGEAGRVRHGCPIALCVREFRAEAPAASSRAAECFGLLTGFVARELGRTGMRPSRALAIGRGLLTEWQGGIALANALGDAVILAESLRRMERMVATPAR